MKTPTHGKFFSIFLTDNEDGSVTVYFVLMMCVLVSLILTSILSAKVSAGRMQAANSVDQALFSLFARYDRDLFEQYDLFFLNAGNNGGDADIASCITLLEDSMDYVLKPNKGRSLLGAKNLLRLERESSAVTAYTLATDAGGIPFEAEAVQAMKQTAVLDGIQLLQEKLTERNRVEQEGQKYVDHTKGSSYDEVEAASERKQQEIEEAEEEGEVIEEPRVEVPEGFVNPLPALYRLYRRKVMDVVVPDKDSISQKKADFRTFVSHRQLSTGLGIVDARGSAAGGDNLYYMAWVIGHFGSYSDPEPDSGLSYQMEYLLKGKAKDKDNLSAVIGDLMKVRQAANMLCLYTDFEKSAELSSLALIIGTVMFIPEAEPIIKLILAALWAYAESLVDVRALLEGKKVAIAKTRDTWQTDPEDLACSGGDISLLTRDAMGGINYKEYLGTFIMVMQRNTLTSRAMDMVESTIRGKGHENFRLDACISALSVEIRVRSENKVTFPVEASMCYLDL